MSSTIGEVKFSLTAHVSKNRGMISPLIRQLIHSIVGEHVCLSLVVNSAILHPIARPVPPCLLIPDRFSRTCFSRRATSALNYFPWQCAFRERRRRPRMRAAAFACELCPSLITAASFKFGVPKEPPFIMRAPQIQWQTVIARLRLQRYNHGTDPGKKEFTQFNCNIAILRKDFYTRH